MACGCKLAQVTNVTVTVTNMSTGQSVTLNNANPSGKLSYGGGFYIQLYDGQPNVYYIATIYASGFTSPQIPILTNTDGFGSAEIADVPYSAFAIEITGPGIANAFVVYVNAPVSVPITPSPVSIPPTPTPTYTQLTVVVTNTDTNNTATLTSQVPYGQLPSGKDFTVQVYNGQPNSNYSVFVDGACVNGTTYQDTLTLVTDSSGYGEISISAPCTLLNYAIQISGPGISGQFVVAGANPGTSFTPYTVLATGTYVVVAQIINNAFGQYVIVSNQDPQATIPYSLTYFIQLFNGEPNTTYTVQIYLPNQSKPYLQYTMQTDSTGYATLPLDSVASQYAMAFTGPGINGEFIVYVSAPVSVPSASPIPTPTLTPTTFTPIISPIASVPITPFPTPTPTPVVTTTSNTALIGLALLALAGIGGLAYYESRKK
ncbi:MAG: hypothetical protein QW046_06170 [Candidatus Micrarchaeaceae archaeon]